MKQKVRKAHRLWKNDPWHPSLHFAPKGDFWSVRVDVAGASLAGRKATPRSGLRFNLMTNTSASCGTNSVAVQGTGGRLDGDSPAATAESDLTAAILAQARVQNGATENFACDREPAWLS
jgi:hypothetical protein